jgi:hypothetical protein
LTSLSGRFGLKSSPSGHDNWSSPNFPSILFTTLTLMTSYYFS